MIAALVLVNAAFAMSELAIVSARPARLRILAERGSKGAAVALELTENPGRFLSTAQSGITLIGVVAGAFSGVSLEQPLGERLVALGLPAQWGSHAGFAVAIAVTTYLNLVVGELVPKQLALRAAEPIAAFSARPMAAFAKVAAPMVWVLDRSSAVLLRLIGVRARAKPSVTEEELHLIIHEATRTSGFGAELAALVQERCFYHLESPIERVTGWDTVMPLYRLEDAYLPDAARIVGAAVQTLEYA